MGVANLHAVTHEGERLLGIVDKFRGGFHGLFADFRIGVVRAHGVRLAGHPFCLAHLGVAREIEHHWAWTSALGYVERAVHRPRHVLGTANLIAPLCDRL